VFVIIDVRPGVEGIPTTAYQAIEEVETEGKEIQKVFKHIMCSIEAEEAEEVGVEHLLRDINDPSTSNLALEIKQKVNGLKGLLTRLQDIKAYLDKVVSGKLPVNNQIIYNVQNILNLLPNLHLEELVNALLVKTNDLHLVMYVSSLVRSILALHDLLNNKLKYKDLDAILDQDATMEMNKKDKKEVEKETPVNNSNPESDMNSPTKESKKEN
jgi:26S proteasome regulatory subunit N8